MHTSREIRQFHAVGDVMKPVVTVVIPTYNRPASIRNCLDALARQTLRSGTFEVVVVDDGSPDPLVLDPGEWAAAFVLRVIRQENSGPSGARNRGVQAARGEILAFTDDDCLPTPEWLNCLILSLNVHPEALVGGSTFNGLQNCLCAETSQLIIEIVYEYFNSGSGGAYFFASNNFACRREEYLSSGGFDTDFPAPGAEDREFCDRWRMLKRPLVWVSSARMEHRHAQTPAKFINLHYRYGRGAYLYQAKRRERNSGTMGDDLGFHRAFIRSLSGKLSGYPVLRRLTIVGLLMVWQLANAVGFFRQAIIKQE
jgi:glycosyltransferase involved in cell wall biosynthesis